MLRASAKSGRARPQAGRPHLQVGRQKCPHARPCHGISRIPCHMYTLPCTAASPSQPRPSLGLVCTPRIAHPAEKGFPKTRKLNSHLSESDKCEFQLPVFGSHDSVWFPSFSRGAAGLGAVWAGGRAARSGGRRSWGRWQRGNDRCAQAKHAALTKGLQQNSRKPRREALVKF